MVGGSDIKVEKPLTDDEAALYDRQIRLWGVDAQKRLNSAKVLIIGMSGVGAEVAKNIILGGVSTVTLLDSEVVTEGDAGCQFLVGRDAIGQNKAEASLEKARLLNPMVAVNADTDKLEDKNEKFFTNFTIIIATKCTKTEIFRLNRIARENDIKFLASDVFGFFGYIFLDLGEHQYKTEVINMGKAKDDVNVVGGISRYISLEDVVRIDWNLEEFAKRAGKTRPGLFGLFVLLEFVELKKRKPLPKSREEDLTQLLELRDEFIENNGIAKEKIPDEFFANVFGEVGHCSAITGGVLAQEFVKAVSQKDPPLVNIFLCDALTGAGYVENLAE